MSFYQVRLDGHQGVGWYRAESVNYFTPPKLYHRWDILYVRLRGEVRSPAYTTITYEGEAPAGFEVGNRIELPPKDLAPSRHADQPATTSGEE